jgi:superfamily II RNA helicase
MVKICNTDYPKSSEEIFADYFSKYSYELHDFQKYAIQAIVEGNHVLVTAPTGSGKTLPGEFALDFFAKKGKKTIYCSPIKALSNQKLYDFSNKYPHISFGIITGDIKCNPDAQVLIMTTEILLNKLYQLNSITKTSVSETNTSFDMDFEKELACVVFDEVHMINDPFRGHVWEQSIIMLPTHVQMVMLSATLDKPEKFALWCENKEKSSKKVYIASKVDRAVPLTHYHFITTNSAIFKVIKDKTQQAEINAIINKPFSIQNAKGVFNETQHHKLMNTLKLIESKNVFVKRQHVLNQVAKYLVENDMLPALCFVLSRKQLEICAKELTTVLLEDDSKIPYIVRRECDQILRKLPNYLEYLELKEYTILVSLLEKGVGIHHAGMMPVLREMVELLFSKGYIKILFCTETLSIGINMPVKTTIFTDIKKFDGNENRFLYAHEYTQMAGRAGRLGIDKVGHVIHLNNLFKNVSLLEYSKLMNGKPQTLVSKFKISYNLLLNLISIGETNFTSFSQKSMIQGDVDAEIKEVYYKMTKLAKEVDNYTSFVHRLSSPQKIIMDFIELSEKVIVTYNKQKRECEKHLKQIKEEYVFIEKDVVNFKSYLNKIQELEEFENQIKELEKTMENNVNFILNILKNDGFIKMDPENEKKYILTTKGLIASQLREVHCLSFATIIIETSIFKNLNAKQIISILSCFTNINVSEDVKSFSPQTKDELVKNIIIGINNDLQEYFMIEVKHLISTGSDYNIHFDLIDYVVKWCDCKSQMECKLFLQKLEVEKGIFLGEFVKALLKINNISAEMEKVAELLGNMELLSKLREIPSLTLKYVVTNQSLYV